MKCACGCQITYDSKDKPSGRHYDYYRCSNGKGAHEKLTYVEEGKIFEQLTPAVESITISERIAKDIEKGLNRTEVKAREAHQRHIDAVKARQKEMEEAEDNLYDELKKGVLDEAGYKRQIARVRKEREKLADVLCDVQKEVTGAVLVTARKILELAKRAPDTPETEGVSRKDTIEPGPKWCNCAI